MKKLILLGAMVCVIGIMTSCYKIDVDTEQPTTNYEPPMYSYGVDVEFSGDTSQFSRNARFYFVTQTGANHVQLVDNGDTTDIENGTVYLSIPESVHLHTTNSAASFEGWLSFVIRDLPNPPVTMSADVTLRRNDTIYYTNSYSISTADTSVTIRLSSEMR